MITQSVKKVDRNETETLLSQNSTFEGKLTFNGTVLIEGKVSGEIFSQDTLIIGKDAIVEAQIDVGEVIILGKVTGSIQAKRSIEIKSSGHVTGDLTVSSLVIEQGALFEGRSIMNKPTTNAPQTPPRPDSPTKIK